MTPRIYLLYDGSIHADWVSRYAIRMAANSLGKKIFLFHVLDGNFTPEQIKLKIKAIDDECRFQHVELASALLPLQENVYHTILASIPGGINCFCICGARITSKGRGFLTGTISEKLMRSGKSNVLAIRVVNPGLLGCPGDIFLPFVGRAKGDEGVMPFFLHLAPDIRKVHLLHIIHLSPWGLRYRSNEMIRATRLEGQVYLKKILDAILAHEAAAAIRFDGRVVLSDDWVKEILVHASQLHARLILIETAERNLASRFLYGRKIEHILRATPCDVALYRAI